MASSLSFSGRQSTLARSFEGHADHLYDGELNALHLLLTELGGLVLLQCEQSLQSITHKDLNCAEQAIDKKTKVNEMALQADEKIVDLLCKHCPIARDLRVIISFSKAVAGLQRISEEASRIALITTSIHVDNRPEPSLNQLRDIRTMGKLTLGFLKMAVNTFDTLNVQDAHNLLHCNEELEAEFESSLRRMTTFVLEDSRNVGHAIQITLVIKTLERLGEHISNLAEYVIYLVEGVDMRYHRDIKKN